MTFAFGDEEWPGVAKLAEECGEVLQVIGKLMMTHGSPAHWSGNLRPMMVDELADLFAALNFVMLYCLEPTEQNLLGKRWTEKLRKFEEWHANMDADPPPALICNYCNGRGVYEGRDVATGQSVEVGCSYCDETGRRSCS